MITPEQMTASQALLKSKPTTGPVSATTQAPGNDWYSKMSAVKLPGVTPPVQTQPTEPSIVDKLQNDISEGAKDYSSTPGTMKQLLGPTKSVLRGVGDIAGEVFKPVGKALDIATGGLLNKAFSNIQNSTPIKGSIIDRITSNPEVQKIVAQHPNAGEDFNRLLNLIFLGEADKVEPDISTIKDRITNPTPQDISPTKIVSDVSNKVNQVKDNTITKVKETIFGKPQEQLDAMTKEWQAPADTPKAGFKGVQKTLAVNPESPKFLAEHGLDPQAHIEDGNYNTKDTASDLRDTAGKMSKDGLRPALKNADYSTPKTPIKDIKPSTSQFGETPDNQEAINERIQTKMTALERKYPDGMSLENMHDEKITYAKNGGYKPFSVADNNDAIANRAISSSLGDMVESKAPKNIPVNEFNSHLQQYYQAADYLDSLQGKKAPVTVGQRIMRATAKTIGTSAGSTFGLPGAFAGYSLGGALEHAVENMSNPVRTQFLTELKTSNPSAYTKVINSLGEAKAREFTQLKLPGGSQLGTETNPIITPAPSESTQIEGRANQLRQNSQDKNPTNKIINNTIDSNTNIPETKNQPTNTQFSKPTYSQIEKIATDFEKTKDFKTATTKLKSMFPNVKAGLIEDIIDKSQAISEGGRSASEYIIKQLNKLSKKK